MTIMERDLLQRLFDHQIADWRQLPETERLVLKNMHQKGWLRRLDKAGYAWLDPAGAAALQAEKERLEREEQQRAEDEAAKRAERAHLDQQAKKQFRHDWRVALFNLLAGVVLGLIADHFLNVVGSASQVGKW